MDINLFHHFPPAAEVLARLDSIDHKQNLILKNQGVKYGDIDVYVDGKLYLRLRTSISLPGRQGQ